MIYSEILELISGYFSLPALYNYNCPSHCLNWLQVMVQRGTMMHKAGLVV